MGTLMLRCLCGIISGRKPVEEKQWPDLQKSCHVTEYGLDPQIGEVYLIQHYVIKFVSDLRQVSSFLQVLWFPPPIK
jgi:hypothetical protein